MPMPHIRRRLFNRLLLCINTSSFTSASSNVNRVAHAQSINTTAVIITMPYMEVSKNKEVIATIISLPGVTQLPKIGMLCWIISCVMFFISILYLNCIGGGVH
jgi:hypothetical protein